MNEAMEQVEGSMDRSSQCANCLSYGTMGSELTVKSENTHAVTVYQAVTLIFKSKILHPMVDYQLCKNCIEILTQLYFLYLQFQDACHPDSHFQVKSQDSDNEKVRFQNHKESALHLSLNKRIQNSSASIEEEGEEEDPLGIDVRQRLIRKSLRNKWCRKEDNGSEDIDLEIENELSDLEASNIDLEDPDFEIEQVRNQLPLEKRGRGRPKKLKVHNRVEMENMPNQLLLEKRGRGRPKKVNVRDQNHVKIENIQNHVPVEKRGRGRPKKVTDHSHLDLKSIVKRKPGRPTKITQSEDGLGSKPVLPNEVDPNHLNGITESPRDNVTDCDVNDKSPTKTFTSTSRIKRRRIRRTKRGVSYWDAESGMYVCPQCGKQAKTSQNIYLHIRGVHEGQRPYQCPLCPKRYAGKEGLVFHHRIAHAPGGDKLEKNYFCPVVGCGKSFLLKTRLERHSLCHDRDRVSWKFQCEECGRKCKTITELNTHMSVHSEVRNFACEECGTLCKTSNTLRKHHRFMHPEKFGQIPASRITCQICHKVFVTPGNMRQHVRSVHYQVKQHRCSLCSKEFSCTSNLRVHLKGFHSLPDLEVIKLFQSKTVMDNSDVNA